MACENNAPDTPEGLFGDSSPACSNSENKAGSTATDSNSGVKLPSCILLILPLPVTSFCVCFLK